MHATGAKIEVIKLELEQEGGIKRGVKALSEPSTSYRGGTSPLILPIEIGEKIWR